VHQFHLASHIKKEHAVSDNGSFSILIAKEREVSSKLGLSERAFLKQRATAITYVPLYMHQQSVLSGRYCNICTVYIMVIHT